MAATLTIKLTDTTTVTVTAPDILSGKQQAQQIAKNGGFFDSAGAWHPASAVVSITFA